MLQTATKEYITQTRFLFYCHCKIKIPLSYGEALINACFSLMEQIDKKYNSHQKGSFFDQINGAAGRWTDVDETTVGLIDQAKRISVATHGAFDITAMPLVRAWGFYGQELSTKPDATVLSPVLEDVDSARIKIHGNAVSIAPGQELFTGSFIKSYAVDCAIDFLKQQGVTDAIINAGGSSIKCISEQATSDWKINIPDPLVPDSYLFQLPLTQQCFSLSGSWNNYIEINHTKHSHIIHAKTGFPAETIQTGVIAEDAVLADMLSTAIHVVEEDDLKYSVDELSKQFDFAFYRIEKDGTMKGDLCC